MIGKLTGILDDLGIDRVLIDVGGVGYIVQASAKTLARLGPPGQTISLAIETQMREDGFYLYGFADTAERDWFRLLTNVQGVGARIALAILSVLGPGELVTAIAAQDRAAITRANGVGPKLAQRILSELKDKASGIALGPAAAATITGASGGDRRIEDAVSALVNLGYRRTEAYNAAQRALEKAGAKASLNDLILGGLKELGQ